MFCYNFKKKELTDVLANVEFFVDNTPSKIASQLAGSPVEDCKVVEMFNEKILMIAEPIESLGTVCITKLLPRPYPAGNIMFEGKEYHFSISKNGMLYIGREL